MNLGLWAILGAAILGAAIAYALIRNLGRDRRIDAETEKATREVYQNYEAAHRHPGDAPDVLQR